MIIELLPKKNCSGVSLILRLRDNTRRKKA